MPSCITETLQEGSPSMHQTGPAPRAAPAIPAAALPLSRQRAALAQFDDLAHRSGDLELILQEACRNAAEGVGAGYAGMLQYRADEQAFVLQAGVGMQARFVGRMRIAAGLDTTAGIAWHANQPVHSRRRAAGGRIRAPDAMAGQGVHRMVSVPVPGKGEAAFGVLEVGSAGPGEFAQHDLLFLQALADSVAAAVGRHADRASRADRAALAAEQRRTRGGGGRAAVGVALNAGKRHRGLAFGGLQQDTQMQTGSG